MNANCVEFVYVEPVYDAAVNGMIRQEYVRLSEMGWYRSAKFIYLPELLSNGGFMGRVCYRFPQVDALPSDLAEAFYRDILGDSGIAGPAFAELDESGDVLELHVLPPLSSAEDLVSWVGCCVRESHSLSFSEACMGCDDEVEHSLSRKVLADAPCESHSAAIPCHHSIVSESDRLEREVIIRIARLRQLGVTERRLLRLLQLEPPKMSRMLITKDYRIIMTDYQEREVKLAALPKALYFLFLRHPEGLQFKQLCDYREELIEFYQMMSNRLDLDALHRSIDDLVDPTSNSVNEKCSRIRCAFVEMFADDVAGPYCITKGSGTVRQVAFDRELLTDMTGLIKI